MRNRKTLMLVEMSAAIALSLVFGKVAFQMPQGGSLCLEMLPLMFVAFRWGAGPAFLAGVAEGLLQTLLGATVVHPAQLIIDYPLAFGLVGLAGLCKTKMDAENAPVKIISGCFIGTFFRYICHVISGVVFFSEYAPKGQNVWLYSIVYNITFLAPSLILCVVILLAIRKQLARIEPDRLTA